MRKYDFFHSYQDFFEYHGNTEILRTRKLNGATVRQDWLGFDSVEEALDYFNTECGEFIGLYN